MIRHWAAAFALAACASTAAAENRFALVVTGAPGGDQYAAAFKTWEQQAGTALKQLGFPDDHVTLLSGINGAPERASTRDYVTEAIQRGQVPHRLGQGAQKLPVVREGGGQVAPLDLL